MQRFIIEVSPKDEFALGIITYIGCTISLVALASAILIFLCLRFVIFSSVLCSRSIIDCIIQAQAIMIKMPGLDVSVIVFS